MRARHSGRTTIAARCVALPLPTLRGADGTPPNWPAELRDLVSSFLKGPSLRTVALEARLPIRRSKKRVQQGCATVLTITLTRKKAGGGGLGRVLGDAAGTAAWHMPYGGSTATSTAVRSAAIAGAAAASSVASNTRAKDELQIEYRLTVWSDPRRHRLSTLRDGKDRVKATSDGEDLVTPLVERMASVVAAAVHHVDRSPHMKEPSMKTRHLGLLALAVLAINSSRQRTDPGPVCAADPGRDAAGVSGNQTGTHGSQIGEVTASSAASGPTAQDAWCSSPAPTATTIANG